MDTKSQKNFILILLISFVIPLIYFLLPFIVDIINKAESSAGGNFEKYIIILGLVIIFYFIILIAKKQFKKLFLLVLLFLPGLARFSAVIHIPVYKNYIIPPLTFIIFILSALILSNTDYHLKNKTEKQFGKILWIFAITGTFTQFINHSFYEAFWLSIGAFWQWVALFYILSGLLTKKKDVIQIIQFISFAILVGILFRIGSEGQNFVNILKGGGRFRVSSGMMVFGPAISYGGYLAIIAISTFYLIKIAPNKIKKIVWVIISLIVIFEMLQTMTRGAYISFSLVVLLLLWKSERKNTFKIITGVVLCLPFIGKFIYQLITYRQFSIIGVGDIPGVYKRLYSWKINLNYIFTHYGLGGGIGNSKIITGLGNESITPHNIILSMCQEVGLFVTLIFLFMYFYVIKISIVNSFLPQKNNIYPYFAVILIAFFIFANTTTTSILGYYPYSSILIFYLFFFLTIFMGRFINPSDKREISRS